MFHKKISKSGLVKESNYLENSFDDVGCSSTYASIVGEAIDKISMVSVTDVNGTFIRINKNFEKFCGYTDHELIGNSYSILSANHAVEFWEEMKTVILKGSTWKGEIKNRAKDGRLFWVETYVIPFSDNRGIVKEYVWIQTDITRQKNIEFELVSMQEAEDLALRSELKRSKPELEPREALLDLVIESEEIGVFSWQGPGHRLLINNFMAQQFETPYRNLEYTDFLNAIHAQDRLHVKNAIEESFINKQKFNVEYRILSKNGSVNYMTTKGNVIWDEFGNVREVVGVVHNVTLRKLMEEQLTRQHEVLNMAIEAGEIGVFDWEVETGKTTWNSFMHQHVGLSVEEFDGTAESLMRRLHPDDKNVVLKAVEESLATGRPVELVYRAVLPGQINHIKCRGILIHDVKGKPQRIVGACFNITKLKQAEAELSSKQEVLNLAIEAGEIGIFSWDIKNDILKGNKYFNLHYGFEEDKAEITFDELTGILHPNDIRKVTAILKNDFRDKITAGFDYRVILKDERTHHIYSSGILSQRGDGQVESIVGVVLNITKQKELEATLRESEKRFRSAMHDSAIGMALISNDGKFIEVNKAILDILGYEKEELLQMDFNAVTHPDDLKMHDEFSSKLMVPGYSEPYVVEKRYLHKGGNIIWGQLNGSMVWGENGQPLYFIGQLQDITLRKQIEEKLSEHAQKLETANNELESFSYSVSHDLRAPLRIINGYVKILQEDFANKIEDDGKRVIETIIYNADKMGQLIDDLLEFSRTNRKDIEKNYIEIDSMVRGIVNELTKMEEHRNIEVKIDPLPSVHADVQMLRQVWYNLIQNAIKYTSKRLLTHIEISSFKVGASICFSVRDNGVGFKMKYVHKVFEVFQRLHSDADFEGTGVGLAIVKRIVDRHGGRIWVESRENEGTIFYFSIPNDFGK